MPAGICAQRPAAAKVKLPAHERKRAPQRAGIRKRAEITRAIILLKPREREARNRVVHVHLEHQETFVIAEADVVTRMKFLDEFAFEQQRLGLATHDMKIKIVDALDQRAEFEVPTHAPGRLKIMAHALAQVAGFADVDDRAEAVFHQIHARLVRQRADFFANDIRHWHREISTQSLSGAKTILRRRAAQDTRRKFS